MLVNICINNEGLSIEFIYKIEKNMVSDVQQEKWKKHLH